MKFGLIVKHPGESGRPLHELQLFLIRQRHHISYSSFTRSKRLLLHSKSLIEVSPVHNTADVERIVRHLSSEACLIVVPSTFMTTHRELVISSPTTCRCTCRPSSNWSSTTSSRPNNSIVGARCYGQNQGRGRYGPRYTLGGEPSSGLQPQGLSRPVSPSQTGWPLVEHSTLPRAGL